MTAPVVVVTVMTKKIFFRYSLILDNLVHNIAGKAFIPAKIESRIEELNNNKELQEKCEKLFSILNRKLEKHTIFVLPKLFSNFSGISTPTIISLEYKKTEELVLHEMAHVAQRGNEKYFQMLENKGYKNRLIRNHILTYALLIEILGKVTPPRSEKYREALEIVQKIGHKEIIKEAKKYF